MGYPVNIEGKLINSIPRYSAAGMLFDAVYPNLNEARNHLAGDKILLGRYILIDYYQDGDFTANFNKDYPNSLIDEWSDEYGYGNHGKVYQKVYQNGVIDLKPITRIFVPIIGQDSLSIYTEKNLASGKNKGDFNSESWKDYEKGFLKDCLIHAEDINFSNKLLTKNYFLPYKIGDDNNKRYKKLDWFIPVSDANEDDLFFYYEIDYKLTEDTSPRKDKDYYEKNGDIYEKVVSPDNNPQESSYYEIDYKLTEDTSPLENKDYYKKNENIYEKVNIPLTSNPSTLSYYEIINYKLTKDTSYINDKDYYVKYKKDPEGEYTKYINQNVQVQVGVSAPIFGTLTQKFYDLLYGDENSYNQLGDLVKDDNNNNSIFYNRLTTIDYNYNQRKNDETTDESIESRTAKRMSLFKNGDITKGIIDFNSLNTVAGCINTLQDLIGHTIIINKPNSFPENDINNLYIDYILTEDLELNPNKYYYYYDEDINNYILYKGSVFQEDIKYFEQKMYYYNNGWKLYDKNNQSTLLQILVQSQKIIDAQQQFGQLLHNTFVEPSNITKNNDWSLNINSTDIATNHEIKINLLKFPFIVANTQTSILTIPLPTLSSTINDNVLQLQLKFNEQIYDQLDINNVLIDNNIILTLPNDYNDNSCPAQEPAPNININNAIKWLQQNKVNQIINIGDGSESIYSLLSNFKKRFIHKNYNGTSPIDSNIYGFTIESYDTSIFNLQILKITFSTNASAAINNLQFTSSFSIGSLESAVTKTGIFLASNFENSSFKPICTLSKEANDSTITLDFFSSLPSSKSGLTCYFLFVNIDVD